MIGFERSWKPGRAPTGWNKTNVSPMSKKGEKEDKETVGLSAYHDTRGGGGMNNFEYNSEMY